MTFDNQLVAYVVLALMTALVVSFLTTPVVYLITAWTVQLLMRSGKGKGEKKNA